MEGIKKVNFFTISNNNDMEYYTCTINVPILQTIKKKIIQYKKNDDVLHDCSLSLICNQLINIEDEFKFSYVIRSLLDLEFNNEKEIEYQKMILENISFHKNNINSTDVYQMYLEKLNTVFPSLDTGHKKLNILREIRGFFSHKDSVFTKEKVKRYLITNLPYSSDIN